MRFQLCGQADELEQKQTGEQQAVNESNEQLLAQIVAPLCLLK